MHKTPNQNLNQTSINDKLVQEVLKNILEPIFELNFLEVSHGFRPNRNCHIALKYLNTKMKDSIWFIEGNLENNTLNTTLLIELISKRVKDKLILSLLRSALKSNVLMSKELLFIPEVGIEHGSTLKTLLTNIYYHELDNYLQNLSQNYEGSIKASNRRKNPANLRLLREGKKSEAYKLRLPSRDPFEKEYRNVKYIRYGDKFLIGVLGSRKLTLEIREKVSGFLNDKLNITLNPDTKINHISNGISFLGYIFSRKSLYTKQHYNNRLVKRHMTIPTLDVDLKKVVNYLSLMKFCDKSGKPFPNFRFLRHPQSESNNQINDILIYLTDWWSIAGNSKRVLAYTAYILRYSLAKVYAAKFKLKTVSSVFKIAGNDLKRPLGNTKYSAVGLTDSEITKWNSNKRIIPSILYDRYWKIPQRSLSKVQINWKPEYIKLIEKCDNLEKFAKFLSNLLISNKPTNPLIKIGWRLSKGIQNTGERCIICGDDKNIQMHHVRSLNNIDKYTNPIHKHIISMSRKQLPLCKTHHLEAHRGNWSNKTVRLPRFSTKK